MSRHDPSVSLRQMRDHAYEVAELVSGRTRGDLDSDRLLALAVVRLLEIIGEAAARVPVEERALRPEVPWSSIVGLRNRLIHGYDDVDHDIVWAIVTTDIPAAHAAASDEADHPVARADHGAGQVSAPWRRRRRRMRRARECRHGDAWTRHAGSRRGQLCATAGAEALGGAR